MAPREILNEALIGGGRLLIVGSITVVRHNPDILILTTRELVRMTGTILKWTCFFHWLRCRRRVTMPDPGLS